MAAIRPIKPGEVAKQKKVDFPDVVFEIFNQLIAQNYSGGYSVIYQKDIVEALVKKGLNRAEIYKNHWLDVEEVYRAAGWAVEYDKPAYCESYEPFFRFHGK